MSTLPRRTVAGYALGSLATGAFGTVPGLVLLYFLTDTLGVAAAVAAVVVLVPKLADVPWNPVVGGWSDRTSSRWGPRRPWMLAGGLLLPPLFVLMFAVPDTGPGVAAVWVGATFLAAGFAYGLFQVPYISLPAELTPDPDQRSSLQLARVVVLSVGILLGGAAAPALVSAGGEGQSGHLLMAAVIAVLLAVAMLGCVAAVPTTQPATDSATDTTASAAVVAGRGSFVAALKVARRAGEYWPLYTGYVVQSLAVAAALAAIPYYATYVLERKGFTAVLFAALVGPSLLVVPGWRRLEARYGKRWCLLSSSWLFAGCALIAAPGWLSPVLPLLGFVGCGIGYAGQQLYAYSMLSDALADEDERTGERRAGLLGGLWTASETGTFAVGPALVGGMLALFGYVSGESGETLDQPGSAVLGIVLAIGLIPAALVVAGVLRYRHLTETQRATQEEPA
jgi:GPH family glycoside/pentoside/hexuronide:cation symporter